MASLEEMLKEHTARRLEAQAAEAEEYTRRQREEVTLAKNDLSKKIAQALGFDVFNNLCIQMVGDSGRHSVKAVVSWQEYSVNITSQGNEKDAFHVISSDRSALGCRYSGQDLLDGIMDCFFTQLTVDEAKALVEDRVAV